MDRREFLQLGAMAGAAGRAGELQQWRLEGAPPPPATTTTIAPRLESMLDGSAADSGIDTVVVLMMENRSFDSYFGWLARDEQYLEQGRSRYGAKFAINGSSIQQFPGPDGRPVKTFRRVLRDEPQRWRGCGHPDPGHGWDKGRAERDGGFLAPGSGNDDFALSYFEGEDLPFYDLLARRFTVCDRWHASLLGPTYPNREYLLSGQSGGLQEQLPAARRGWLQVAEHRRPARGGERHRRRIRHRPSAAPALGRAHATPHSQDRRVRDRRGRGQAPERHVRQSGIRRRQPHRRSSARRPPRRAGLRARRVRRVREVTAVGAGLVRAHVRRVGRLLRPRRATAAP